MSGEVPNVVAVVPIRGADPETPRSGMLSLAGRPLLAYTVDAAAQSRYIRRVLVSTDDPAVAEEARRLGADVPFLRPPALAAHDAPLGAVLRHAIGWMDEHGQRVDFVALLEITHPVRPPDLIDKVIEVVVTNEELDCAFAAREERHEFWTFDDFGNLSRVHRREEMPRDALQPLYKEMGGLITVMRADVARGGRRLGDRVAVVPVRDLSSLVDLREEGGVRLAELLLRDLAATPRA
jgi:CMP-N,N'-diacetyllegionaminic acid synthase